METRDLSNHPQTMRVLRAVDLVTSEQTKMHMKIGSLCMRQNDIARLCVENIDVLNITIFCQKLPKKTQVFLRSSLKGGQYDETVSSRLEIYYPVKNVNWFAVCLLLSCVLMVMTFVLFKSNEDQFYIFF